MQTDNVFLIICGTLILVLLINAGILVALLRSESSGQLKVLGKAFESFRDPWGRGNKDLKELRERISKLENLPAEDAENDH
ncbi:MAG: hypothetical protein A2Z14_02820 [Chloroflexi bacterium RBG_16_48_8]|nr:MAG: hypothetical protein A2Z14_02820 [Chloroflexi bacterium RBG_16_48_8]